MLEAVAKRAAARSTDPTRHKCFVSYHQDDADEAESFIDTFGDVLIAKVLGVSDEDDFINSDDADYVMRRIRELYLSDSTVTIILVGKCTWARKYVDWEIASTLRNDERNKRSGLLGITLPSAANYPGKKLPSRLADNLPPSDDEGFARWAKYPTSNSNLESWIDDAYLARSTAARYDLINNISELFKYNRTCP
jgi:hypothetical protein